MKKIDVTQPVAMATPFAEGVYSATSTDDFEIPAATSTTADDSCVMDDGFLPITSTALDDGGKAPERKNFNGMFYLSTDQRFFLQNGGFITYNPDVAAAIGGYPQDAILDFIDSNGTYKKVRSLIDDNSNNFVADETLIDGTNWEEIQMGGGSGYEVGDIVIRNTPTNDAGKHLLDGALIQYGSYQAFVDYIADLYNNTPAENVYNVNIVGSLTNNNGVLSGFSASNYAVIPEIFNPSSDIWEFNQRIKFDSMSRVQTFFGVTTDQTGFAMNCETSGVLTLYMGNSGWNIANGVSSTLTLSVDTWYDVKVRFTGTQYLIDVSADNGTTWINYITINSSASISASERRLGNHIGNAYFVLGSIDLNGCYINIDGKRWWSGKTEKRSGFLTEEEWQATVAAYGSCGKFVYDSVNNTVRLPKVSDILQGTTDLTAIGDLIEAGLPNITGRLTSNATTNSQPVRIQGAFNGSYTDGSAKSQTTSGAGDLNLIFNASNSNPIYKDNFNKVQPQTIKVLYYIVIATTTKTDIQVDIDEIATDLNGKADVDLTNVNDSGTSKGAGWAMPSGASIDLTLGASGTTYTAPANGWIFLEARSAANMQYMKLVGNGVVSTTWIPANNAASIYIPVQKNDHIIANYNTTGALINFKFTYAVGSESEAN